MMDFQTLLDCFNSWPKEPAAKDKDADSSKTIRIKLTFGQLLKLLIGKRLHFKAAGSMIEIKQV